MSKFNIKKIEFMKIIKNSDRDIDHLSPRQLDYRYHEYELYKILHKYREEHDFSFLMLPETLEDYDIYTKSPVTLNDELHRLYESGYFDFADDFIDHVIYVIDMYSNKNIDVKTLVKLTRKIRLEYEKKMSEIKDEYDI